METQELDRELTDSELMALLQTFKYKPGWVVRAARCPLDHDPVLHVTTETVDSTAWTQRDQVQGRGIGPVIHYRQGMTRRQVEDETLIELLRFEDHEIFEFASFGRRAPFHPHRADGQQRINALGLGSIRAY